LKIQGVMIISILLLSCLVFALPAAAPVSATSNHEQYDRRDRDCKYKPKIISPKIEFIKWERSATGVKFYYKVTAGSKDIQSWTLTSPAFRRTTLTGTSETPYFYKQNLLTLIFAKNIEAGQSRIFWFDLKLDYQCIKLGKCFYTIEARQFYMGHVRGPV
jgi:hypothetical protein